MNHFKKHIFLVSLIVIFIFVIVFLGFKIFTLNNSSHVQISTSGKQISSNYFEYSAMNFQKSAENGKTVLFFATNWCSTCTELDRELMESSEKLDDGITILKVDFDKDSNLKRDYKVLVQHTLVQVDNEGKEIAKWVGGDIDQINREVK